MQANPSNPQKKCWIYFIEKKVDIIMFVATYRMIQKFKDKGMQTECGWLKDADLKQIGENDKLYLRGHGSEGNSTNEPTVGHKRASELAKILREKKLPNNRVIKVVGCHSGNASQTPKSFVKLLIDSLLKEGIFCKEITGITNINIVNSSGQSRALDPIHTQTHIKDYTSIINSEIFNINNFEKSKKQQILKQFNKCGYKQFNKQIPVWKIAQEYCKALNPSSLSDDFAEEMECLVNLTEDVFKKIYNWANQQRNNPSNFSTYRIWKDKKDSRFHYPSRPPVQQLPAQKKRTLSQELTQNGVELGSSLDANEQNDLELDEFFDVEALINSIEEANASQKYVPSKSLELANAQSLFPHLHQGFNYAFSEEPILLNGMKVLFDNPTPTTPVTLQRKQRGTNNGR